MMMIILTTPGGDDYYYDNDGDDYYFYDDGYRFVQLSIQNWTNSILTTPGPPSLKMTKRGPPRFELILDRALCEGPRQQIIPGLGCQVTGVGAKEDLDLPVWGARSTRWANHESGEKRKIMTSFRDLDFTPDLRMDARWWTRGIRVSGMGPVCFNRLVIMPTSCSIWRWG